MILDEYNHDNYATEFEYELEDLDLIEVHAFGVEFKSYYPKMWDTLGDITVNHSGKVQVSSGGSYPMRSHLTWYQGDESWCIGYMDKGTFEDEWGNMVAGLERVSTNSYIQCKHECEETDEA